MTYSPMRKYWVNKTAIGSRWEKNLQLKNSLTGTMKSNKGNIYYTSFLTYTTVRKNAEEAGHFLKKHVLQIFFRFAFFCSTERYFSCRPTKHHRIKAHKDSVQSFPLNSDRFSYFRYPLHAGYSCQNQHKRCWMFLTKIFNLHSYSQMNKWIQSSFFPIELKKRKLLLVFFFVNLVVARRNLGKKMDLLNACKMYNEEVFSFIHNIRSWSIFEWNLLNS